MSMTRPRLQNFQGDRYLTNLQIYIAFPQPKLKANPHVNLLLEAIQHPLKSGLGSINPRMTQAQYHGDFEQFNSLSQIFKTQLPDVPC